MELGNLHPGELRRESDISPGQKVEEGEVVDGPLGGEDGQSGREAVRRASSRISPRQKVEEAEWALGGVRDAAGAGGTRPVEDGQAGYQRGAAQREMSSIAPDEKVDEDGVADGAVVGMDGAAGHVTPPAEREEAGKEEDEEAARRIEATHTGAAARHPLARHPQKVSRLATELYTISYLIFFSLLGTLARLGMQWLTVYPGAPVVFGVLWANVAGSVVFGFFGEDRVLFRDVCDSPAAAKENGGGVEWAPQFLDVAAAQKAHNAAKKTTPLYIGIATGFCGSFTSFSSLMRDAFLALSNRLPTPGVHAAEPRNGGYSFMALLAVLILTFAASIGAFKTGGHLAVAAAPFTPQLPRRLVHTLLDRLAVLLGLGCWLGAVLMAALPPDRHSGAPEVWRGRAVFALVFAPLGCLARFYAALWLNSRVAGFPLGTFAVNVGGTAVLGAAWDLQHAPVGGRVGCQVLQGVMDGFCGCVTTVSTMVSELTSLRRSHAYVYGAVTVLVALGFLVVIMGSLQWTRGFAELQC